MRLALNAWFWNSPTTGSGQYTRQLVKGLADVHPEVQVVLVTPSTRNKLITPEEAKPSTACVTHSLRCPRSNLSKAGFEQLIFPRICSRIQADLAHIPYWAPPLCSSVPVVVTIHDLIPLLLPEYGRAPLQRLHSLLVGAAAHRADMVLTDSEASRQDILLHLGIPGDQLRVVPPTVDDCYHPDPMPNDAAIRSQYGLEDRYVLYLGGFDVRKNLSTVLATYRWVGPAIGERCPLVIAGSLPQEDTAFEPDPRRLMVEKGVCSRFVRFTGFVDECHKPAIYRGALALIFPSRYEGFGLPLLEALACGTPVVGSNATSIPEVVGDAGTLVPFNDAKAMGSALVQLALDEQYRTELSHRAVVQASKFSRRRVVEELVEIYGSILASQQ